MPASAALRSTERMRAWVYWMKGPVLPLKSIDSRGSNSIVFLGSTFNIKYLRAPSPTIVETAFASSSVHPSSLPSSADISRAVETMSAIRSSASTTVPSRDFILPSGSSTIP